MNNTKVTFLFAYPLEEPLPPNHAVAGARQAMPETSPTNWHRLFGMLLTDFFTDSPFTVELEKDLSRMKQLLDVVVLRRGPGRFTLALPDGLDNLATHN